MDKIFYKYRGINNNTLDSIRNNYFYCSAPSELNDITDSVLPVNYDVNMDTFLGWISRNGYDAFRNQLVDNYKVFSDKTFQEKMTNGHKKTNEKLRIFCLSEVWNESEMWAHYADSNKGICLGYKSYYNYNSYFIKVEKQNNPFIVLDGDKKVMVLLKVNYTKTEIHSFNLFEGNQEALIEAFRTKEPKWAYENEYRIVYINRSDFDENKKLKYDKRDLVEVIFGIKTPKDEILEIYDLVKNNFELKRITFYKMRIEGLEMRRDKITDINNL